MNLNTPSNDSQNEETPLEAGRGVYVLMFSFLGIAVSLPITFFLFQEYQKSVLVVKENERQRQVEQTKASDFREKDDQKKWERLITKGRQEFLDAEYTEAERNFEAAVKISRQFRQKDKLVFSLNDLATVKQVQNKKDDAEKLYKEAIKFLKEDRTPNDKATSLVIKNYGKLLAAARRPKDASILEHEKSWIHGIPVFIEE